jgi:hypothetical protein
LTVLEFAKASYHNLGNHLGQMLKFGDYRTGWFG